MPEARIAEAATLLGTSVDTVRRRVKRGELHSRTDAAGRVWVDVPDLATPQGEAPPVVASGELDAMRAHIATLTAQLQDAQQAQVELRQLLMVAQQNLARLALPMQTPSSAQQQPATAQQSRPWWKVWRQA